MSRRWRRGLERTGGAGDGGDEGGEGGRGTVK